MHICANGDASKPRDDMKGKGISHRIYNRYRISETRRQEKRRQTYRYRGPG